MILPNYPFPFFSIFLIFYNYSGDASQSNRANKVYCVISMSNTNNGCQGYNFTEHNTLTHYLNHSSKYFNSHETYVFQNGYHTLLYSFHVRIENVTNLTLTGPDRIHSSKEAMIDCNGRDTFFHFYESLNAVIANITFISCIRQQHNNNKVRRNGLAVIVSIGGANFSLIGVSVFNAVDYAFLIYNTLGNVIISNVVVANSTAAIDVQTENGNAIVYNKCTCKDNITSNLVITNSTFVNNSIILKGQTLQSASGLNINIQCPNVIVKIFNLKMFNNTGYNGGNLAVYISPMYLYGFVEIANSMFEGGRASKGAGMFISLDHESKEEKQFINNCAYKDNIHQRKLLHIYNSTFTNNVADQYGGGVCIKHKESLSKCNRIDQLIFERVTFTENALKLNSSGFGFGGIALHSMSLLITDYLYHGNPQFQVILNDCSIHSNYINKSIDDGSSGTAAVFVKSNHLFNISNTAIFHNKASGIIGMSSNIILSQNVTIFNNIGSSGGGMLLCQNAVIYIVPYTTVIIAHNRAISTGGGISIETYYFESQPICFFQLGRDVLLNKSLIYSINVSIYDNHAGFAGNNIFGGSIEHCYMIKVNGMRNSTLSNSWVFEKIFNIPNNTIDTSSISSPPRQICSCQKKKPSCSSKPRLVLEKFPGETFTIEAAIVGQFNGTVPGTVQTRQQAKLKQGEYLQNLSSTNSCNQLNYTIYTNSRHEVLELRVQHIGDISGFEEYFIFSKFTIHVQLKNCPLGFTRTNQDKSLCDCSWLLRKHGEHVSCEITTQTVQRMPPVWIGNIEMENGYKTVAFHSYCPINYCLSTKVNLFASNDSLSQDNQCAFNRTGVLCGSCSEGLSVVLGASECRTCSNYWILLFILFAVNGIVFLIILILFDMTIADGTLSGIIFYCNIVEGNISTIFPTNSGQNFVFLTSFIKIFFSLINLKIGVSMCLFDGMDSYTKTWLDFAYPLYLWLLTGVFIFIAGGRCSWIVRRNAVKVLATFILLSCNRLLSSVAESLQVSVVQLDSGVFELRWLIDGNIKYFQGKHIPLAIFAIMLGLLLLLFALCLFFIQCLQKASGNKLFSWIHRLKPFFDVYTGPFTSSGRFWTGLLLLSRGILLVVSAVNVTGAPNTILGSILTVVLVLFLVAALLPAGLYRQRHLNVLEYSSLVNLGVLSSLLLIFKYSSIVSHIFVSIEIFIFIGVLVHHISKNMLVRKSCCYRRLGMLQFSRTLGINKKANQYQHDKAYLANISFYAEDREPLLATT